MDFSFVNVLSICPAVSEYVHHFCSQVQNTFFFVAHYESSNVVCVQAESQSNIYIFRHNIADAVHM